jgi:hypothetical protein
MSLFFEPIKNVKQDNSETLLMSHLFEPISKFEPDDSETLQLVKKQIRNQFKKFNIVVPDEDMKIRVNKFENHRNIDVYFNDNFHFSLDVDNSTDCVTKTDKYIKINNGYMKVTIVLS